VRYRHHAEELRRKAELMSDAEPILGSALAPASNPE
jgi:hypothetical protein